MADIAAHDGDKAAALAGYRQLENSSLALTARTRAAAILLPDDRAAAFALLDDYAVAHPEEGFELTLTKIHLLSEHDETDAGLALIQAALERHPKHPALEYERAVLLERAGKVHESVATLDRLIVERLGNATLIYVDTPAGQLIVEGKGNLEVKSGEPVGLKVMQSQAHLFGPTGAVL